MIIILFCLFELLWFFQFKTPWLLMLSIKLSVFFIIVPLTSLWIFSVHEYILFFSHKSIEVFHDWRFFILSSEVSVWQEKALSIRNYLEFYSDIFKLLLYFQKVFIDIVFDWFYEYELFYIMFLSKLSQSWKESLLTEKFCCFSFRSKSIYHMLPSCVVYDFTFRIETQILSLKLDFPSVMDINKVSIFRIYIITSELVIKNYLCYQNYERKNTTCLV